MLKNRLIAAIFSKGSLAVQSFNFKDYRPIGRIKNCIDFYSRWDVDEIILIDIDATREERLFDLNVLKDATSNSFVPICVGGGIRNISDIGKVLGAGADKVSINNAALIDPKFIEQAAQKFGSQSIVVSIDVTKKDNVYYCYDYFSKRKIKLNFIELAKLYCDLGAGEILLNSIDRDGSREGYDTELLRHISNAVSIPVIAIGGVGRWSDFSLGILDGDCQAVAAANIFNHTEHSIILAKCMMREDGINVRPNLEIIYEKFAKDIYG